MRRAYQLADCINDKELVALLKQCISSSNKLCILPNPNPDSNRSGPADTDCRPITGADPPGAYQPPGMSGWVAWDDDESHYTGKYSDGDATCDATSFRNVEVGLMHEVIHACRVILGRKIRDYVEPGSAQLEHYPVLRMENSVRRKLGLPTRKCHYGFPLPVEVRYECCGLTTDASFDCRTLGPWWACCDHECTYVRTNDHCSSCTKSCSGGDCCWYDRASGNVSGCFPRRNLPTAPSYTCP